METQTIRFSSLCENIGRSDSNTNFHSSEYERLSQEKQSQRELVLDYVLSHFDQNAPIRALTLPGERWIFEKMLCASHKKSQVVGLEKSVTTFFKSAPNMVCANDSCFERKSPFGLTRHRIIPYGESSYQYFRTSAAFSIRERSNRLLNIDLGCYASMISNDYGQSFNDIQKFHEKFMRRNAAWIDLTGNLSESTLDALSKINVAFSCDSEKKPLVITFMYGRDMKGGIKARTDAIRSAIKGFEVEDVSQYAGKNNCPMLTILGYIQE